MICPFCALGTPTLLYFDHVREAHVTTNMRINQSVHRVQDKEIHQATKPVAKAELEKA